MNPMLSTSTAPNSTIREYRYYRLNGVVSNAVASVFLLVWPAEEDGRDVDDDAVDLARVNFTIKPERLLT